MRWFFAVRPLWLSLDVVLLLVRVVVGVAIAQHGFAKIHAPFSWAGPDSTIPGVFQALAALGEFGGGIGIALGFLTRLSAIGILCTMLYATKLQAFTMGDPFVNLTGGRSYEMAVLFLMHATMILTLGPGDLSVDRLVFGRK